MRIPLILATMVLATMPASAQECEMTSTPTEVDALGFYVDTEICQTEGCITSVWIYQETNGHPGLQRNDDVKDDTCGGRYEQDTIIF